jgi:hypothetical protein
MWSRLGGQRLSAPQDATSGVWTAASTGAGRVDVLVSSFLATGATDRTAHVDVGGVKPGRWKASVFRVDSDHPGSTTAASVANVNVDGSGHAVLDLALPAQSVVLVELTRPSR